MPQRSAIQVSNLFDKRRYNTYVGAVVTSGDAPSVARTAMLVHAGDVPASDSL
ncbi:hypothetical protein V7S43_017333 [Phytophthora oleae]|uniref:Uncharacterized protein n=1 Tax=Phytophthora oleae TaxID=2107226 RepID=A0ABD3EWT5_9STRA